MSAANVLFSVVAVVLIIVLIIIASNATAESPYVDIEAPSARNRPAYPNRLGVSVNVTSDRVGTLTESMNNVIDEYTKLVCQKHFKKLKETGREFIRSQKITEVPCGMAREMSMNYVKQQLKANHPGQDTSGVVKAVQNFEEHMIQQNCDKHGNFSVVMLLESLDDLSRALCGAKV